MPGVINKTRDKLQHRWKGHVIFAELHCDGAGELSSAKLEEALKSQVKGPKPRLEGVDPMRVKSHARMEAAVKDVELGVKRMMLANSMPADKWRCGRLHDHSRTRARGAAVERLTIRLRRSRCLLHGPGQHASQPRADGRRLPLGVTLAWHHALASLCARPSKWLSAASWHCSL